MKRFINLTKREAEVLSLVAAGKPNKEIAQMLGTAERTIEQHLTNSYRKLDVYNRTEAALAFLRVQYEPNLIINRSDPNPLVESHDRQ
jgi:DNA-binding NarL/FixJ family response regulator